MSDAADEATIPALVFTKGIARGLALRSRLGESGVAARVINVETTRFNANDTLDPLVLIDFASITGPELTHLLDTLKLTEQRPAPILIGIGGSEHEAAQSGRVDIWLNGSASVALALARYRAARRRELLRREARLRALSCRALGATMQRIEVQPETHSRVLVFGSPTPRMLALSRALEARGKAPVLTMTAATAFSFLHEDTFSYVIVDTQNQQDAAALVKLLRRSPRWFNLPVLAIFSNTISDKAERELLALVDDIALETDSPERLCAIAERLSADAVTATALRESLQRISGPEAIDAPTGLFSPALFQTHLSLHIEERPDPREPVPVIVINLVGPPGLDGAREALTAIGNRGLQQAVSLIRALIRAEDFATRLGWSHIAIALPGATKEGAREAAERISGVLEATVYDPTALGAEPIKLLTRTRTFYADNPDRVDEIMSMAQSVGTIRAA
jgi:two-component system cell cycle response regulator PopA